MFWLARLIRLLRPMPPTPTAAMLSVSLGGANPRPRTLLGTMVNAAPPAATSVRKVRREIAFFLLMSSSPREHYGAVVEVCVGKFWDSRGSKRRRALVGDGEGALEGDPDATESAFLEEAPNEGDAVRHAARGRKFGQGIFGIGRPVRTRFRDFDETGAQGERGVAGVVADGEHFVAQ